MFRLLFDLVRTVIFMIAVTAAFVAGGIVFNLDRLGNLDVHILKYKKFLPKEERKDHIVLILGKKETFSTTNAQKGSLEI